MVLVDASSVGDINALLKPKSLASKPFQSDFPITKLFSFSTSTFSSFRRTLRFLASHTAYTSRLKDI